MAENNQEQSNEQESSEPSVDNLIHMASKELIKIKSVFPFTLFPTEIIVDELKVTIVKKGPFYRQYFPILIQDLKTVNVWHGMFFATLKFEISGFETNPDNVRYLWKREAVKAHQLLMGLMTVTKTNAGKSLDNVPQRDKARKLTAIGHASTEPSHPEINLNKDNPIEFEGKSEKK